LSGLEFTIPATIVFILGLALGSFANVVISRVPAGRSFVAPRSRCPHCGTTIRWRDNIPVVSWLALRAKCRDCGGPISWRYPGVEIASGILWLLAVLAFGVGPQAVIAGFFFWMLLVLTFIDIDTMRLPNPIVAVLGAVGMAAAAASQLTGLHLAPLTPAATVASPIAAALLGSVTAAGLSWGIAAAYERMRGQAGLGMGDVKLLAAIGPFLGLYTVAVIFVGSVLGAGFVACRAYRRGVDSRLKVPFGPFLAGAAVLIALFGAQIWDWYLRLIGLS